MLAGSLPAIHQQNHSQKSSKTYLRAWSQMHLTVSQSATSPSFIAGTTCMPINRPNYMEMAQDANGFTTTIEAQLFCCNCAGAF